MKNIYIIILILLTVIVNTGLAQNKLPIDTSRIDTTLFKRNMLRSLEIPELKEQILSPQIALMNQYGDYPVNLSNGLVDISIPLYNIQTSKLSLPLQLKFHPSGLKALEKESMLGVRWVLDAGGHISRSIKGYPDEMLPFRKINGPDYRPNFNALYGGTSSYTQANSYFIGSMEYRGDYKDTEYDIFSYSLPAGKSGKFIMADNNGEREAITIPYEALKITPLWSYGGLGKFDVIDTDGIQYIYGLSLTGKGSCIEEIDYEMNTRAVAWYLTGIISADKQDTISIDYKQYFYSDNNEIHFETLESYDRYFEWSGETIIPKTIGYRPPYFDYSFRQEKPYLSPIEAYTIDEIKFKGGSVKFNYTQQSRPSLISLTILDNIIVYNNLKQAVKKISFNVKMNDSNGFSLLHEVNVNDLSTKKKEIYRIDYYDSIHAPSIIKGGVASQSDWWGYHSKGKGNFVNDTTTFKPHNTHTIYNKPIRGSVNMAASEESMKWGMIKSIQYPTGGKTLFDYEVNQYTDYGVKKNCGGLRIKKLTNITEQNKIEEKEYEYDMDVFAPYFKPLSTKYIYRRNYFTERKISFTMLYHAEGMGGIGPFSTRTQGDLYHRSYRGTVPSAYSEFSNIISYNEVTEKIKSGNKGLGKTVYYYDHQSLPFVEKYPEDKYDDRYITDNIHIIFTDFWKNRNLGSKAYYHEGETKSFKTISYYYDTKIKKSVYDMYIFQYLSTYPVHKTNDSYSSMEKFELDVLNTPETFSHVLQKHDIGKDLLTMEVETTYIGDQKQSIAKEYTYDPVHFILESEKITSNKEVHKTNYKYPFNYTQEPYKSMVANNILSPVVEKSVSKNDTFLERLITNYKQWAPKTFSPLNIQYQKGSKPIETRLAYNFDGRNQLREAIKDDISKVVYIRNAYSQPIAEIEGVSYDDVAKTLGQSTIDKMATSFVVSEADMLKINNLRTSLPQSSVTTYTYKPLVGITSIIDPQGAKIFYEYDESNRLLNIKDMDGNTIESYDYHFSN